ncbi:MAG TPA: hypothetical protein VF131_14835 [Blastocatellia bacterium]|nr:hypothetical protein [Blastocatellia bacterium]
MSTFTSTVCPYKGLRPYTEADRDYFFGREQDTEIIASNLYIAPLTILYGTSGAGKSSVLQAGVIPRLVKEPRTVVVYFNQWQGDAFIIALKKLVLDEVCRRAEVTPDDALGRVQTALEMKQSLDIKSIKLDDLLIGSARALRLRILLIFDQFEEYFLYHSPQTGVEGFDAEFARAVNQEEAGVNFMLSMREEELSKLDRFRQRIPNLLSNLLRLEHLDRKSATRAIIKPLKVYNLKSSNGAKKSIELGLVKAILEQVNPANLSSDEDGQVKSTSSAHRLRARARSGERIETPFLQLVLMRLWEEEQRLGSNKMRLSTLERLEGAKNIARTHLDEVMKKLDEQQQKTAASILRFLVTPSGTKIAQQPSSLAVWATVDPKQVREVLVALSSKQEMCILRKVSLPSQEDRYELFHDVLGPAILDWLDRYAKQQQAAEAKVEAERKLKEAQEDAERRLAEERNQRLREQAKRQKAALIAAIVMIMIMTGLTIFAFSQKAEAARQAAIAAKQSETLRTLNDSLKIINEELEEERRKVEGQREKAEENYREAEKQKRIAQSREKEAVKARQEETVARAAAEQARERANLLAATEKTNRLGLGEARAGHTEDAMELFKRAKDGYVQIGDLSGEASAISNIAETYTTIGNLASSAILEYLSQPNDQDEDSAGAAQAAYAELMLTTQLQEFGKKDEKRRLEMEEARKNAVSSYNEALGIMQTMESNYQPEHKNKALVLKRLGDIQILLSLQSLLVREGDNEAKEEARKGIREGVRYYQLSSLAYSKADDLPKQAKALRTAASTLYLGFAELRETIKPGGDPEKEEAFLKDVKEAIAYFKGAAEIYNKLGDRRSEASMLLRVAMIYDEALEQYKDSTEQAIIYYKQAIAIFSQIDRPELEAKYEEVIANLYVNLGQKENAFTFYDMAFRSRLKAERLGIEESTIPKEAPLRHIGLLYAETEEGKQKLDTYFRSVVDMFPDPAEKAALFSVFSGLYRNSYIISSSKKIDDKARALYYLDQQSKALQQANLPAGAAKVQFEIGKVYKESNDLAKAVQSFDAFIQLYRAIDPNQLDVNKKPVRYQLDTQLREAGQILNQLDEKSRAIEAFNEFVDLAVIRGGDYSYSIDDITKTLGKLYLEKKNVQAAEDAFRKGLSKTSNNSYRLAGIGDVYSGFKEHAEFAERYYQEAITAYQSSYKLDDTSYNKQNLIDPALRTLQKISKLYAEGGDESKAKSYLTNYAETARQAGNPFKEALAREALAVLYAETKNNSEALKSYELARSAYQQIKAKTAEVKVLRAMSKLYEGTDDVKAKELSEEAERLSKQN